MRHPGSALLKGALFLLPPPPGEGWGGGTGPSRCTLRLFRSRSRGFVPAAESLSFASPKESNQRKGDPAARVPPLRCGQPAVLASGGVRANSPAAQTCAALFPPEAALLGARRGDWGSVGPLLRSAINGLAARGLEQGYSHTTQGGAHRGLVTLFGEAKKVTHPPGRNPGSSLGTRTPPKRAPGAPTPTLPRRGREQERITAASSTELAP